MIYLCQPIGVFILIKCFGGFEMIEKLYGNIPSYGKSYLSEKCDEIYINMVKMSLDATIDVVDVINGKVKV